MAWTNDPSRSIQPSAQLWTAAWTTPPFPWSHLCFGNIASCSSPSCGHSHGSSGGLDHSGFQACTNSQRPAHSRAKGLGCGLQFLWGQGLSVKFVTGLVILHCSVIPTLIMSIKAIGPTIFNHSCPPLHHSLIKLGIQTSSQRWP